jgi:hypothetical protein
VESEEYRLMAVIAGRTEGLRQYNSYDWARDYAYTLAGWGAVTPVGGPKSVSFTVAGAPTTVPAANTATDQHRVLWGRKSGQGYECASRRLPGTATTFTLLDLPPATTFYGIRLWHHADGRITRGAEFTFATT